MSSYSKIQPRVGYSAKIGKAAVNSRKQLNFFFPQQQTTYQKIKQAQENIITNNNKSNNNKSKNSNNNNNTPNVTLNNTTINSSFSIPKKDNGDISICYGKLKTHRLSNSVHYNNVTNSLNETLRNNNKELSKLLSTSQREHMPFIKQSANKIKQQILGYSHLPEKKSKCMSAKPIAAIREKKLIMKDKINIIKTPIKKKNKRTLSSITNNDKDTTMASECNNKLTMNKSKASSITKGLSRKMSVEVKKEIKPRKIIKAIHDKSKTGLNGEEKKVNQDSFFIFNNFNGHKDYIYMGVCDGHGCYGNEVSGFIKENLPIDMNQALQKNKADAMTNDIRKIIETVFTEENKKLLNQKTIDTHLSGTTCVSAIYTPEKLIVANIGDSRCVLGKYLNKKWVSQDLSRDHKPSEKDEAERILKKGRIRPMLDENGEFIGPPRVYMKEEDVPGLAMTRSFGDYFASLAGTISVPEITVYKFQPEDKFVILASDGLYEFINSQDVVTITKDYYLNNDIVGCCEFLYEEAKRRWINEEQDAIDDITMIVVFFE